MKVIFSRREWWDSQRLMANASRNSRAIARSQARRGRNSSTKNARVSRPAISGGYGRARAPRASSAACRGMSGHERRQGPPFRKAAAASSGAAMEADEQDQEPEVVGVQGEIAEREIDGAQDPLDGEKCGQRRAVEDGQGEEIVPQPDAGPGARRRASSRAMSRASNCRTDRAAAGAPEK